MVGHLASVPAHFTGNDIGLAIIHLLFVCVCVICYSDRLLAHAPATCTFAFLFVRHPSRLAGFVVCYSIFSCSHVGHRHTRTHTPVLIQSHILTIWIGRFFSTELSLSLSSRSWLSILLCLEVATLSVSIRPIGNSNVYSSISFFPHPAHSRVTNVAVLFPVRLSHSCEKTSASIHNDLTLSLTMFAVQLLFCPDIHNDLVL